MISVVMHMSKYKLAVVIGRMEPMHDQHTNLFKRGLELADQLVVLFGGCHRPRTIKNPLLVYERQSILDKWAKDNGSQNRIDSAGVNDYMYSDSAWVADVQKVVNDQFTILYNREPKKGEICLVGCEKDSSSYYLKMFPQWDLVSMPLGDTLDSTQIRKLLFEGKSLSYISGAVPEQTLNFLREFKKSSSYEQLVREYEFIQKYKKAWEAAPYEPTFITTDAWVVQSGHVLLIQRKKEPGHGLWAAPGGFLGIRETLIESMIRELKEETKIKVPAAVLEGSIIDSHVFDSPDRSTRGRTVTHSFLIKLKDDKELAHVKAADDAMAVRWVPFNEIKSDNMYEDHEDQWQFFKNKI
jgi:bifunctional NMN adenylyltransferase/nudix hydrolase